MKIPKIIHQIWSGIDEPLPKLFKVFGETWKKNHPDWKYEFWDNEKINNFVLTHYPQHWKSYNQFTYNVQRWDAIRYLILDKIGGMYVDFDTECLTSLNDLLKNKTCCFSMEPPEHWKMHKREFFFNNALMASVPEHPFMKHIIKNIFENFERHEFMDFKIKGDQVQNSTGPMMLVNLYEQYSKKDTVYLIPYEYVSPLTNTEIDYLCSQHRLDVLEKKLEKAYSIHYFFNTWLEQKFA